MISQAISLLDNPHNLTKINHIRIEYGTLVVAFDRDVSRYRQSRQSMLDFERLLRNYATFSGTEYVFDGDKFVTKFEHKIITTY